MFYGDAADFENYFSARGFELPVDWDEDKINAALLVASEWLDSQYEDLWIGYKNTFQQERSWPRQQAMVQTYPYYNFKNDEIPIQVIHATYEAAKRELTNTGSLQIDYQPSQYSKVSVYNAVTVEYNSAVSSVGDVQTQIPIIQSLMSILIDGNKGGNSSSLVGRAARC